MRSWYKQSALDLSMEQTITQMAKPQLLVIVPSTHTSVILVHSSLHLAKDNSQQCFSQCLRFLFINIARRCTSPPCL